MRLPKAAFTLLRATRALRYRTLDDLVGRTVTIRAPSTVLDDVTAEFGDSLRDTVAPTLSADLPTVAKYGLLDLELESRRAWSLPRPSIRELRALGLLTSQEDPDIGIELLEQFADEIAEGRFFIKLMLDAQDDTRDPLVKLRHLREGLPSDYFPRRFEMRDACVTNGPTIWLGKHFYM